MAFLFFPFQSVSFLWCYKILIPADKILNRLNLSGENIKFMNYLQDFWNCHYEK